MKYKIGIPAIALLIILILLYLSIDIVNPNQAVILNTKPLILETAGLHWKSPVSNDETWLDLSAQNQTISAPQLITQDQNSVNITVQLQWKIQDPVAYYSATKGDDSAMLSALEKATLSTLQGQVKTQTLKALLTSKQQNIFNNDLLTALTLIAKPYAIQVVSVQITQIHLTDHATQDLYTTMQNRFTTQAATIQATGDAQAQSIKTAGEEAAALTLEQAEIQATQIRAQADASAALATAKIYQQDPDFYRFYRSLTAYQDVFANNTHIWMVLKPQGEFFQAFNPPVKSN